MSIIVYIILKWWIRRKDSNQRFPTYEDGEIDHFSTPKYKIMPGVEPGSNLTSTSMPNTF